MNELERKIEQLEKYIEVKEQECNDLQEKIKEAIEILYKYNDKENNYYIPVNNIIDILKGDNK